MDLFKNLNLKPFIISFIAIFLMVSLPKLGFNLKQIKIPTLFYTILSGDTYIKILNPQPTPQDKFENIKPRLEQTPNNYQIKKLNSLIKPVSAEGEYQDSSAYGVIDFETGEVIAEKNLSKVLPIASLTKIMTSIVALDLAKPDEQITVSQYSTTMIPSKVFLEEGEKLTVEELIDCFMLSSANDCVQALADGIDQKYGQKIFIRSMNQKAKFLGLKNTHFENPQGFDGKEHFSTVEDLSILSHYALTHYPLFQKIVQKPSDTLEETDTHNKYFLNNWNGLLGVYPGTYGIKIGNTDDAGKTTIVVSQRQGKKILALVLGAPGVLERDLWASQLLDLGFQSISNLDPINLTESDLRQKYSTWVY